MTNKAHRSETKAHPHKSTTVPEKYFHYRDMSNDPFGALYNRHETRTLSAITAFARQAPEGGWYVSFAECDSRDQFNRSVGRNVARRKWFDGKTYHVDNPSYESIIDTYFATSASGYYNT